MKTQQQEFQGFLSSFWAMEKPAQDAYVMT